MLTDSCGCRLSFPLKQTFSAEYCCRSLSVLETALNRVAAYRRWRSFDLGSQHPVDKRYAAMPAFTKKDIRDNFPQGLVPRDRDINSGLASGEVQFVETSGTLDDSVTNIWNQKWWDASEKASWKLNSNAERMATANPREAILASPLNVGFLSDENDLPMEKRRLSRFLFLNEKSSPLSWTAQHMDRMIRELEEFQPVILEANPSLLARLCRYITAHEKNVFQPSLVVFTYEYPTNYQYRQIRRVFNVPTASSYGSTETGYVFMQCERGKFHQNTEFCRVDFLPLKPEHGGPFLGKILVTTFNNPWNYVVRFDIGDLVRLNEQGTCPCGRGSGLVLSAIEGRFRDTTLTCKGRLVTLRELDDALSVLQEVDEYQLFQASEDAYRLHLVSQRTDKHRLSEEAEGILEKLYGKEANLSVIFENAIAPEPSGKYRLSRTLFPVDTYKFLDERYAHRKAA